MTTEHTRNIISLIGIAITLFFLGCKSDGGSPSPSGDTTPPTNGSLSVNSGSASTLSSSVSLSISADDALEMYVTNISGCNSGGSWESYSASKSWSLADSDGTATVYIKFRDSAGNTSSCYSDSISFDNTAPSAGSISIQGGATAISTQSVTLTLAATGATEMCITNTAGCTCSGVGAWESYNTTKAWTLGQTNSNATVYVKFRDDSDNRSNCYSDNITHDNIAPSAPSSISDGSSNLSLVASPAITWAASSDSGSGVADYQIAIGSTSGGTDIKGWTSVGNNLGTTVSSLNLASKTTYYLSVKATDVAGNTASVATSDGWQALGWSQQAYLKAPNIDNWDEYGWAVAIDGDTAVVGVPEERSCDTSVTNGSTASPDNTCVSRGAAYVLKRTGSSWVQEAYLKGSGTPVEFGYSVSISGDTIAVGARKTADGGAGNAGKVYLFTRSGTNWSEQAVIGAVNAGSGDNFGNSVDIDGDTLVVGAWQEDSNQTAITNGATASSNNSNTNSGAAYVYTRSGGVWSQEAYLKASNNDPVDLFGISVAVSGDNIVVGAYREDSNQTTVTNGSSASADNSLDFSGAAYVFKRTAGAWAQEAYLKAPNGDSMDEFGGSVDIDGDTIVVGASAESSNQASITNGASASSNNSNGASGAVYVFRKVSGSWAQEAYLKASNSDAGDFFGSSVRISGHKIVVGALEEASTQTSITNGSSASSNNSSAHTGAAYVFSRTGSSWEQQAYIKASNAAESEYFANSVAISSDSVIVGAYWESGNQNTITNSSSISASKESGKTYGAAYVFTY